MIARAREGCALMRGVLPCALLGCSGDKPAAPSNPAPSNATATVPLLAAPPIGVPPTTVARTEEEWQAAVDALVPSGSMCIPASLKTDPSVHLVLLSNPSWIVPQLCAVDRAPSRLLGALACWGVDWSRAGSLSWGSPPILRGYGVKLPLVGRCVDSSHDEFARVRYCIPDREPAPPVKNALLARQQAWRGAALVVPGAIHLFDRDAKWVRTITPPFAPESLIYAGEALALTNDQGTVVLQVDGGEQLAEVKGRTTVSIANENLLVIADALSAELQIVDVNSSSAEGAVERQARKQPKTACKPDELAALIADPAATASAKCRRDFDQLVAPWMGASFVLGDEYGLVQLRGKRLGEIAKVNDAFVEVGKLSASWWCK